MESWRNHDQITFGHRHLMYSVTNALSLLHERFSTYTNFSDEAYFNDFSFSTSQTAEAWGSHFNLNFLSTKSRGSWTVPISRSIYLASALLAKSEAYARDMILGLASISYLLFVRMTYASCSARGQPNVMPFLCILSLIWKDVIDALTDFRTATPFTYTETVYAFDCSTDPTTFTAYVWITISSSIYTANACTYTLSTDPIDYCLHIFPSLMATQFIPGSPIVVVYSHLFRFAELQSGLNIPQMQSALT